MARGSLKSVMRLLDNVNNQLPEEQQFLFELKKSIELDVKKNARKPSQTYKPSSMNCIRNMYYQVIGVEPDESEPSYIMQGIVESGSDIHIRKQQAILGMKENGFDCEYLDVEDFINLRKLTDLEVKAKDGIETKVYNKRYNMSFMTDGIIKYKSHYYILEIKTETSNKFWQRKGVDSKHYNQAVAYSLSFGLDEVIFLYISRDTLDMKSFLFRVTDDMKQELVGMMENCNQCIENNELPKKPQVDTKVCEYCNYRGRCSLDG